MFLGRSRLAVGLILGLLAVRPARAADPSVTGVPSAGARWEVGLVSFRGPSSDTSVRPGLAWETVIESGVVGFDVVSVDDAGEETRLNRHLIPAQNSASGGHYFWDASESLVSGRNRLEASRIQLRVWGEDGRSTPWPLRLMDAAKGTESSQPLPGTVAKPGLKTQSSSSPLSQKPRVLPNLGISPFPTGLSLNKAAVGSLRSASLAGGPVPGGFDAFTGPSGVYRATAAELASALNQPLTDIRARLLNHSLGLANLGQPLQWTLAPGKDACLFFLPEQRSVYLRGNVFQSAAVPSPEPARRDARAASDGAAAVGSVEQNIENDVFAVTTLPGTLDDDFWVWDNYLGIHPILGTRTYSVNVPGVATDASAPQLTIDLASTSETTHAFEATLNGRSLGLLNWTGRKLQSWKILLVPTDLISGTNTLVLSSLGDRTSLCYLDRFRFRYARPLVVSDTPLIFDVDHAGSRVVRASNGSPVDVWDISDPAAPVILETTAETQVSGGATVATRIFEAEAGHHYVAFRADASRNVLRWQTVGATTLQTDALTVDYLVISPESLIEPARRLAAWRDSQGLASRVVTLTQLQHEFSFGMPRPNALQDLLAHARQHWRRSPRYVVLLGDGTYDYRAVLGGADNLLPPPLIITSFGRAAADPQMLDSPTARTSVGRLSVKTSAELHRLIDRMQVYESSPPARPPTALLHADRPDAGGEFIQDSDQLGALVEGVFVVKKAYNSGAGTAVVRSQVRDELGRGVTWWNYVGHGGRDRMGVEYVAVADVPELRFGSVSPLVTGMTCSMGQFALPGLDCLAEALLLKDGVGPLAVWSPSGFSINYQASQLNRIFAEELTYARSEDRVGDVLRRSRNRFLESGGDAITPEFYNLLGDPALRLPFAAPALAPRFTVQPGTSPSQPWALVLVGEAGSGYQIETTDSLTTSGSDWTPVEWVRIPDSGRIGATNFLDPLYSRRFFRARRE